MGREATGVNTTWPRRSELKGQGCQAAFRFAECASIGEVHAARARGLSPKTIIQMGSIRSALGPKAPKIEFPPNLILG